MKCIISINRLLMFYFFDLCYFQKDQLINFIVLSPIIKEKKKKRTMMNNLTGISYLSYLFFQKDI